MWTKNDPIDIKMCGIWNVGPKWQIVIPKEIRDILKIETWDSFVFFLEGGKRIGMVRNSDIQEMADYLNDLVNYLWNQTGKV